MAKGKFLKLLIWFLSSPIIIYSYILEVFMPQKIRQDLNNCLLSITNSKQLPEIFILALITAEDHRSELHFGIDPIGILRSISVKIKTGKWQGASTVEQQYVRIITNRFERTGLRKLREQILAIMLSRRVSKHRIASAYLSRAFYGTDFIGTKGLKLEFGENLSEVSFTEALRIMVQLKYPRPKNPSADWQKRNNRRLAIIIERNDSTNTNIYKRLSALHK